METVTGYVGHIVFRNEENGYTVFHLENDDGEVTCVGNFNFINEGEMLELTGEYVNHNVYGTQLKVSSHVVKEPEEPGVHREISRLRCGQRRGGCPGRKDRKEI